MLLILFIVVIDIHTTELQKSLSKMCCLCFNLAFSTSKTTEQNKPLDKIFVWPLCLYISIPAYLSFLEGAMCKFYFLTSLVMPLSDCNTL